MPQHIECDVTFDWQIGENKTQVHKFIVPTSNQGPTSVRVDEKLSIPFEAPIILHLNLKTRKAPKSTRSSSIKSRFFGSLSRKKSIAHSFSSSSFTEEEKKSDENHEFDCIVFVPVQDLMDMSQLGRIKVFSSNLVFKNMDPRCPIKNFNASLTWHASYIPHLSGVEVRSF